jgi:nicotinate-nucleotide adenylyltransferase
LREIRAELPEAELFLIVGSDTARLLPTWREHEEVGRLSTLVVVNRPDTAPETPSGAGRVEFVVMKDVDVSSSAVRAAVSAGGDVTAMVTPAVAAVISGLGLYGARA